MSRDYSKHLVLLIDEHRVTAGVPGDAQPVVIDLRGRWSDLSAEALGKQIKDELGTSRLSGGRAVVGVPVSWVLTQQLSVPSSDPVVTAGAVRMRMNRDYATDAGDLVGDYTTTKREAGSDVLLGVTTRGKVRKLHEVLAQAGLRAEAVYITAQLFAGPDPTDATVLRIHPPMLELALVRGGRTIGMRSLSDTLPADDPASTARTISTSIATDPQLSMTRGRMVLAADASCGADTRTIVAQLNGVTQGQAEVINRSAVETMRLRAGDEDLLDLVRCRASQIINQVWTPKRKLSAAVAGIVLLILLLVGGLWWAREHRLATLRETAAQMRPEADALGEIKSRLDSSGSWFDKRVDVLSCMLALTECVPARGELWLAEFRVNGEHTGSLQGRAESRSVMLEFLRALQASEKLTDVALRDSAETQDGGRLVRFEITFRLTGTGGTH
ncbi:MAG: PilN domain-containing protein [Phycisphaerales bacterium]